MYGAGACKIIVMIYFKLHPYTTIVFEETTYYSGLGDSMICAREMIMQKDVLYSCRPLHGSFYGRCSWL